VGSSRYHEDSKINVTMKESLVGSQGLKGARNSSAGPRARPGSSLIKQNARIRGKDDNYLNSEHGDLMRIEPISIPTSKAKLYHYINVDNEAGTNTNPPIKATMEWFQNVYQHIFKSYSYMYPILKPKELFKCPKVQDHINLRHLKQNTSENEHIFDSISKLKSSKNTES